MKKYQSYKPSGIEWIGEIPEHWIVKKMKYFVKICNGSDYKDFVLEEGGYPVYGTGGVFSRSSKFKYDKISVLLGRKGTVDKPQIVDEPFWTSDTTYYTEIKQNVSPYYFFHLVNQIQFELYIYGSAIPSMTKSVYDEMLFPYPPFEEQQQIIRFLDEKTKIIDKLISTKERKIELLKLQRTSLINQVITKGLDPNVKMKDSGVKWIGEIPEHWTKSKLRYLLSQKPDNGLFKRKDDFGSGVRFVNVSDLFSENNKIKINDLERVIVNQGELDKSQIEEGDIFFVRSSLKLEGIGVSSVICDINEKVVFDCHIIRVKPNKQKTSPYFLISLLNSNSYRSFLVSVSETVTMTTISQDKIKDITIFIPSQTEQQQIIEFLDTRTKEIDDLISLEQRKIDVLKDYRKSLISEVITGKIDVRTNLN